MYLPSQAVWDRMHAAQGGLWIDRTKEGEVILVLKMSTDVLKAVYNGSPANLVVAVVRHGRSRVRCVGAEVFDDPDQPVVAFRTHSTAEEQRDLQEYLSLPSARLFLFDELSRCVAMLSCVANADDAESVLRDLADTAPHYIGENRQIREGALDRFQADLDAEQAGLPVKSLIYRKVRITLKALKTIRIVGLTQEGAGRFMLDDTNDGGEGSGLEQSIHQLLDNVFGERLYRSPRVGEGASRRELIDIMGISAEGIVLIESKVHAILASQPNCPREKRARKISKAIDKALSQLGGAVRMLRSGAAIYRSKGEKITISPGELRNIQGLVLVSSMYPELDWRELSVKLKEKCLEHESLFQTLDLIELRTIVGAGERSDLLHLNLAKRCLAAIENGNAYLRVRPRPPAQGQTR